MSVIVTVWVQGDPQKLEQFASENADHMRSIVDAAKQHGVIAHRFYGTDGQIMVIDEWPDEQSFRSFFEEQQEQIAPLVQATGASSQPGVNVWHKLETHDEVGWDG